MLPPMGLLRKIGPTAKIALFWRVLTNKGTPWWAKLGFVVSSGAYILSPIDLVPDFIIGLGWLDDLIILPAFAWVFGKVIPGIAGWSVWDVFEKNEKQA